MDVFFVLSGYLITGLLVAEIEKTSRLSLLQFYARRARRLLPASALVLLVTLAAGSIILAPQELTFAGRAARATALYMSNVFFAVNAADYFAPNVATNPMLHTWSLAVEEQFYLFWPVLIMAALQFRKSRRELVVMLAALTVVSLAASVWLTAHRATFAFYNLPARAWEFGIGGLAVLLPAGALKLSAKAWIGLGWLGLLTILASGYFISAAAAFPGWVAIFPVVATAVCLVAAAEQPALGPVRVLQSSPLQFLGTMSYSWYLWHWPLLVFAAALLPNIPLSGKVAVSALSLVVAAITHYAIENPVRFHPALTRRPALSLGLAAALTVCSLGSAVVSMRFAGRLADAPGMKAITAAVDDIANMPRERCVSLGDSSAVKTCAFGNSGSATEVVLFGDSHAIQWFNPLNRLASSHGWRLSTFVKSGCPATDIVAKGPSPGFAAGCAAWRAEAIRQIVALRPSLVFIGNANGYLARRDASGARDGVSLGAWQDGTRRTLSALVAAGLRVVAIRDVPLPGFDIPTCLARSLRHSWYPGGACEIDRAAALDPAVFEAEKASASGLPNVHFVDLTDRLCRGNSCAAVQDGEVIYRDDNHLTGTFAESLMPVLERALLPLLAPARS